MIDVDVLNLAGYYEALYGIGLSRGLTSCVSFEEFKDNRELVDRLSSVALSLSCLDGGHNKFLESIVLWVNIDAPRYFWVEFDTYRVGVTKQSESTMYSLGTLLKEYSPLADRFNLLSSIKRIIASDIIPSPHK